MKRFLSLWLLVALLCTLWGCDAPPADTPATEAVKAEFAQTDADMFTDRDKETAYEEAACTVLSLSETVTITQPGTYLLSGTLDEGQILVDAGKSAKIRLILQGVQVTASASAALYIKSADKVFVTLADGTENSLTSTHFPDDGSGIDGAVFSRGDLTFNGTGTLTVTSPAGHGIVCKDDLVFTGGNYTVTAASHGLDANDSVRLGNAQLHIDAGKDGIHAENTDDSTRGFVYLSGTSLKITAQGDGIHAGYYAQICSGTLDLHCGGGYENGDKEHSGGYGGFPGGPGGHRPRTTQTADSSSMKGIKTGSGLLIEGGSITVDSADDCLHAASDILLTGGSFQLASGDDAIHSDTALTVTAGDFTVSHCYEGLEAEKIYIQGGDFEIHATDDGLNAAGGNDGSGGGGRDQMFGGRPGNGGSSNACIEISGGHLQIYAGGDGLDSNGSLTISGGYTCVANPTAGDTSVLDSDGAAVITGGTYIGLGITSNMAQSFGSSSTQGVIACKCGNQPAGSELIVTDSSGKELLRLTAEYQTMLLIISTPQIISGQAYTITLGAISGTVTAG